MITRGLAIFVCCLLLAGCGYTTRGFQYPEDSIFITPVVNKINITSESRKYSGYSSFPILLERRLTNALVNKFNSQGQLKVVSSTEGALKLDCFINKYNKETLRYSDSDDVKEQRLTLRVAITLTSASDEILKAANVVGESSYFLIGPHAQSESSAQDDLIADTVRRITEVILEQWQ